MVTGGHRLQEHRSRSAEWVDNRRTFRDKLWSPCEKPWNVADEPGGIRVERVRQVICRKRTGEVAEANIQGCVPVIIAKGFESFTRTARGDRVGGCRSVNPSGATVANG